MNLTCTLGALKSSSVVSTVGEALPVYEAVIESRKYASKTRAMRLQELSYLRSAFGSWKLSEVFPCHLALLTESIADTGRRCTARHVLTVCRDFFNEALVRGWVIQNPALHVRMPKAPVERRRLDLNAWVRIHRYAQNNYPAWAARSLELALLTGQRRADVACMRFDDVRGDCLHVTQQKTGARIAIPLEIRISAVTLSLRDVIEGCERTSDGGPYLLQTVRGTHPGPAALSFRFAGARKAVGMTGDAASLPTLHEIRSLSERLYRAQGVDTKTLLGHSKQSMTDLYNDERRLHGGIFKRVALSPTQGD